MRKVVWRGLFSFSRLFPRVGQLAARFTYLNSLLTSAASLLFPTDALEKSLLSKGVKATSLKTVVAFLREVYHGSDAPGRCTDKKDREAARNAGTLLVYGEVLPEGVVHMMSPTHLNVGVAAVLLDVGSGRGQLALQCFEQFTHLRRVIGVELSDSNYSICSEAMKKYTRVAESVHKRIVTRDVNAAVDGVPRSVKNQVVTHYSARGTLGDTGRLSKRSLEFYHADVGTLGDLIARADPDIVTMDVAFNELPRSLGSVLASLSPGTRLLTYEDIQAKWPEDTNIKFPFRQINVGDRYLTSWQPNDGHGFYMWVRRGTARRERKATAPLGTYARAIQQKFSLSPRPRLLCAPPPRKVLPSRRVARGASCPGRKSPRSQATFERSASCS